jgi:Holliday junction resolvasome RuvABC endonuclease subunit
MRLLAIDPGNIESGYVIIDTEPKYSHLKFKILEHGNVENLKLLNIIESNKYSLDLGLIEMIQSYGQAVGETIFNTCRWIGKFELRMIDSGIKNALIFRKSILAHHLNSVSIKSPDSAIRKRLLEVFPKESKGITSHSWQALALGVMYLESKKII